MICPVCPTAGWFGGWIGGYFGIDPPPHTKGRIISAIITASLVTITVVALKYVFNISLCVGGEFTPANVLRVGIKTLLLGIVYSIATNYLLNRYVFPAEKAEPAPLEMAQKEGGECCCCHKSKDA